MHPLIKPVAAITRLDNPVLIAGFATASGATAAAAVAYLAEQWHAEPLADIDPDELFVFTGFRPLVLHRDGERVLEWPTNRFFVARPRGAGRDIVLLAGVEPHLRWRGFTEAVASFMHEAGTREAILVGAYPVATPHTRPLPVWLSSNDDAASERFGIAPTVSRYQGPIDIRGTLDVHLSKAVSSTSLSVMLPFYANAEQNPRGMLSLVEAIDRALGTETPLANVRRQAAIFDEQADAAVRHSEELEALVRSLEERLDAEQGEAGAFAEPNVPDALTATRDLVADVEQFLREQPGAGHSGGDGKRQS